MNRVIIRDGEPGTCWLCADTQQVRVDLADWNILTAVACPVCDGPARVREFLAPLMDYLARPGTPGPVTA